VRHVENQRLINNLNQLLANSFVLYVKLQRYHWYVQGRHFFELHDRFEEMYTMFAEKIDEIAERILMIHGKPIATMTKFLKETTLEEATADDKENELIKQLHNDYEQIVKEIVEESIPLAENVADEPTLDLLIDIQGTLEKYMWMLRAYQAYE